MMGQDGKACQVERMQTVRKLIIIPMLLFCLNANAETRLYFSSTDPSPISPSYSSEWEKTNNSDRLRCLTKPSNSAMSDKTSTNGNNGLDDNDILTRQYVSDPLKAQTISGTAIAQIRCQVTNTLANASPAILVKVVSGDGSTTRGTLFSEFSDDISGSVEFSSTMTNRTFPASGTATLSAVAAQLGDRIVVEIGCRYNTTAGGTRTMTHSFGDNSGSDLPENNTETNPFNPWIEFSQDIEFAPVIYDSTLYDATLY